VAPNHRPGNQIASCVWRCAATSGAAIALRSFVTVALTMMRYVTYESTHKFIRILPSDCLPRTRILGRRPVGM